MSAGAIAEIFSPIWPLCRFPLYLTFSTPSPEMEPAI